MGMLLTIPETAKLLKRNRTFVERLIQSKILKFKKIGNRTYIREEWIEKALIPDKVEIPKLSGRMPRGN